MDSLVVTLEERYSIRSDLREVAMRVSLPQSPLCCTHAIPRDEELRYRGVPKHVYLRDMVREISRHVEDEIIKALKRTGVL